MKFLTSLFAVILLFCLFTACHKSDNNSTTPVAQDTLGAWQKIKTDAPGFADIGFLTPARGFAAADGIYNSNDSGKTWSKMVNSPISGINLHLLNAQRGALIAQQGIYITDDYINWRAKSLPASLSLFAPDLQFTSAAIGYISTNTGLFKTSDTANTFTRVYSKPVNGLFFFDDNNGIIYDYSAAAPSDIFKTTDGGANWQSLAYIPGRATSFNVMQFVNTQAGWLSRGDSLFNTINGGANWSGRRSPGGIINDIQFLSDKIGYIAAAEEIYKTTDGGQTWTISCKLAKENIIEIFFLDEKTGWACGELGSILRLKQ